MQLTVLFKVPPLLAFPLLIDLGFPEYLFPELPQNGALFNLVAIGLEYILIFSFFHGETS